MMCVQVVIQRECAGERIRNRVLAARPVALSVSCRFVCQTMGGKSPRSG